MHAFDAELRRLLARRLLRVLFGLVIIGFLIAGVVTFFNSSDTVTVREIAPGIEERFDDRFHLVEFLDIAEEINGLLVLFFVVVGATAIGAEWTNRNLTATLTFEPRRGLLLAAKLASVVLVAFLGAIFLEFILLLCMMPAALLRGTTEGVDSSWWIDYMETIARAGFVGAFGATLGLSIATIGRNTAAALGASFVYFAILESLLRAWKPHYAQWLIGDNMAIVASGETDTFEAPDHGPGAAAIVLLVYGAAIYVLSAALFRNRDIA
jgi:ABC-type transport system involved in multi-copper enzyme maturation permease subunit